ncbi:EamA-like transporter [Pseudoscourfieldia marina]
MISMSLPTTTRTCGKALPISRAPIGIGKKNKKVPIQRRRFRPAPCVAVATVGSDTPRANQLKNFSGALHLNNKNKNNNAKNAFQVTKAASSIPAPVLSEPTDTRHNNSEYTTSEEDRWQGILMLNMLTFLFGSNIAVLKGVESAGVEPGLFTAMRFGTAALCLLPFALEAFGDAQLLVGGLELGVWASGAYATQAVALLTADSSRVSFLSALTVIAVPLIAGAFGREISPRVWGAAAVAIAGIAMLTGGGGGVDVGDAWGLLSALLFAVHIYRSEHYAHVCEKAPTSVIGIQMLVVAGCSFGWYAASGEMSTAPLDVSAIPWLPLLYTGLITTAGTLWLEMKALRNVSAQDAALVYTTEPLWGALFAWAFLGERWGALGWVGAAMIVMSSATAQMASEEET